MTIQASAHLSSITCSALATFYYKSCAYACLVFLLSLYFWFRYSQDWQVKQITTKFDARIVNPEQVREFFSSYTIYTVTSPLIEGGVKRRYSDFDWMRTILVARFHGMAVPLLPEKRVVGNTGDAFIEERRRGLTYWLQLIVANPYLRNDHTLRLFMTVQTPMEWEQAKRAAASGTGSNPAENEGLRQWFGCLRHYRIPVDHETAIAEVQADADEADNDAMFLLSGITDYYEASKRMTEALKKVRGAI